jgi:hypothetical protein
MRTDLSGWGSFTDVAAALSADQPITRQQVYSWWRSRHVNRFPDKQDVPVYDPVKIAAELTESGYQARQAQRMARLLAASAVLWLFELEEVARWHKTYVPVPGRPKKGNP